MSATADVQAFIDAQNQLRRDFGSLAVLLVPETADWPEGTRINPDTGEPYDSMVLRTNPTYAETTITALVIQRIASTTRNQADERFEPAGLMSSADIILDVAVADFAEDASDFVVAGDTYQVEEWKPFEVSGTLYRYLLYGQKESD